MQTWQTAFNPAQSASEGFCYLIAAGLGLSCVPSYMLHAAAASSNVILELKVGTFFFFLPAGPDPLTSPATVKILIDDNGIYCFGPCGRTRSCRVHSMAVTMTATSILPISSGLACNWKQKKMGTPSSSDTSWRVQGKQLPNI